MAATETIQLESFNTALHGARILLQGPFAENKLPPIMEWIQRLRDPFKKKILLTSSAFTCSTQFPQVYDAVFYTKDVTDFQLCLAYLTYAGKPSLLVMEDPPSIPDGFWPKLPRTITVVHLVSTRSVVQLRPYDAIFFAPMQEMNSAEAEYSFKILQSVYRGSYSLQEHREILSELRVAGAGIAWTNVEEERQGGTMYWYDTVDAPSAGATGKQIAEVLRWVARTIGE